MNFRHFIIYLSLAVFVLAPSTVQAQTTVNESAYRQLLLELIVSLQKQIKLLQEQIDSGELSTAEHVHTGFDLEKDIDFVSQYNIQNPNNLSFIKDSDERDYFARVFDIFPDDYDDSIKQVAIFSEESLKFDAFVQTLDTEKDWMLAVNEVSISTFSEEENNELLIHEFAHILSYDESLGKINSDTAQCEPYFQQHGCPSNDSYLRKYVNEFWTASDLRRAEKLAESDRDLFEEVDSYYQKNQDSYVSEYAATSPEEDFSETFMWFVLDKEVGLDTEAEEKIKFFNRFSRFLELKVEIGEEL